MVNGMKEATISSSGPWYVETHSLNKSNRTHQVADIVRRRPLLNARIFVVMHRGLRIDSLLALRS